MLIKLRGFEKELKDIGANEIEFVVDKVYTEVENYIIKSSKLNPMDLNVKSSEMEKFIKYFIQEQTGLVIVGYDFLTWKVWSEICKAIVKKDADYKLRFLVMTIGGNNHVTLLGQEDEVEVYGDEKSFVCRY